MDRRLSTLCVLWLSRDTPLEVYCQIKCPSLSNVIPSIAYTQEDTLSLVTTGPLQGKYVYTKVIRLVEDYLKKRSSVLGYSYVTSKSSQLLINNNLDINVLISPTGGYEAFKKGCHTICNGRQVTV